MNKMICADCVTPDLLKKVVSDTGTKRVCTYCDNDTIAAEVKFIFDYILQRVDENVATEDDLSHFELGMLYECGSDEIPVASIDVVLAEWLGLGDEKYFNDLMDYVPKSYLNDVRGQEKHYFGDDGTLEQNVFEERWNRFVEEIRYAHRFFNPNAKEFLESLFSFLSTPEGVLRPECIRIIGKGDEIYRARVAHTPRDAKNMQDEPWKQFGTAPKDKVGSQRMTPSGISALYCAFERATCLSEIRSITGDHVVSVALTPVNELKLLDLTKLEAVEISKSTLLDVGYRNLMHLHGFVSSLVTKMSRPRGRSDELAYLSTQVIFEYLRLTFASQVQGLVFPSVQTGENGTNVVLFPESSTVSKNLYYAPGEMMKAFGDVPDQLFEDTANLACIAGSLRFHKVRAIVTEAEEFSQIYELYQSDLDRRRFNFLTIGS